MKPIFKKIVGGFLSSAMLFGAWTAWPLQAEYVEITAESSPEISSNKNWNNYYAYYSYPVKSYLYTSGSNIVRLEHIGNHVTIEEYSPEFKLVSSKTIQDSLPLFGGFYQSQDANYLIYGQENAAQNDQQEVLRVVRYDRNWSLTGSASIKGANTQTPFHAGSLKCAFSSPYLYILTSHKLYSGHQANWRLVLNTRTMSFTDNQCGVSNSSDGYVAHSFNQLFMKDGADLVAVEQGDTYPRGLVLNQYLARAGTEKFYQAGSFKSTTIQQLPGSGIYTYAKLGGVTSCNGSYLISYEYDANQESYISDRRGEDIYAALVNKQTGAVTTKKLNTGQEDCSAPVLAPVNDHFGYIFWVQETRADLTPQDNLYYVSYDNGTFSTPKQAKAPISDCQPILYQGKPTWYVTDKSTPTFYQISDAGVTSHATNAASSLTIKLESGEHGSAALSQSTAKKGEQITVSTQPESGYTVDSIKVVTASGKSVSCRRNQADFNQAFFTMPDESVTVQVSFKLNLYTTVDLNYGIGGSLSVSNTQAKPAEKVTITPKPYEGKQLDTISVIDKNGGKITLNKNSDGTFWFIMPEGGLLPVKINATFKKADTESEPDQSDQSDKDQSQEPDKDKDESDQDFSEDQSGKEPEQDPEQPESDPSQSGQQNPETENPDSNPSENKPQGSESENPYANYKDLDMTDWYSKGVKYVIDHGIMTGLNATAFAPSNTTNRAMIVTILHRLENKPEAGLPSYVDVDNSAYFAKAAAWAYQSGVMTGYSSSRFGPLDPISREQMATVLFRYARFKGCDTSRRALLSSFSDSYQVSDFAKEAMEWCLAEGIITGKSSTWLDPKGACTRAQAATIFERFSHIN